MYVARTVPRLASWRGSRILGINGHPLGDLLPRADRVLPSENRYGSYRNLARLLLGASSASWVLDSVTDGMELRVTMQSGDPGTLHIAHQGEAPLAPVSESEIDPAYQTRISPLYTQKNGFESIEAYNVAHGSDFRMGEYRFGRFFGDDFSIPLKERRSSDPISYYGLASVEDLHGRPDSSGRRSVRVTSNHGGEDSVYDRLASSCPQQRGARFCRSHPSRSRDRCLH